MDSDRKEPTYKCGLCGAKIEINSDKEPPDIKRACEHKNASIVVDLKAHVYGLSSIK